MCLEYVTIRGCADASVVYICNRLSLTVIIGGTQMCVPSAVCQRRVIAVHRTRPRCCDAFWRVVMPSRVMASTEFACESALK